MRILVTGADGQLGNEMQVLAKENPLCQHRKKTTDSLYRFRRPFTDRLLLQT